MTVATALPFSLDVDNFNNGGIANAVKRHNAVARHTEPALLQRTHVALVRGRSPCLSAALLNRHGTLRSSTRRGPSPGQPIKHTKSTWQAEPANQVQLAGTLLGTP